MKVCGEIRRVAVCGVSLLLATLAVWPCVAAEVLDLNDAQRQFLAMSAAERRNAFTNVAFREAMLGAPMWEDRAWRTAKPGETSRFRHLPGVPNMRDLGGLVGLDGRRIRRGLLYRSAGLNGNAPRRVVSTNAAGKAVYEYYGKGAERLTDERRALARRIFGIRTDLDLRSDGECHGMTGSPLGPETKWVHVPSGAYGDFLARRESVQKCLAVFFDEQNYPIVFHCISGADRTGSLAYLLEALLGVSDDDLALDWELTAFCVGPNWRHSQFDALLASFAKCPGTNARERAESVVRSLGYTDVDIARFREFMLEEKKPRVKK